jgi:hypothetical protein
MLILSLLPSLAGFLIGTALAHHLGHQAGSLPFPAEPGGWQALALTGGLGLLALELAIAVFGKHADQET